GGALAPLHVDLPGGAAPLHLDRGIPEIEGEARDGAAHGVGDELLAAGREIGGDERHERADDEDRGDEDDASPGREARRTSNFWHAEDFNRAPAVHYALSVRGRGRAPSAGRAEPTSIQQPCAASSSPPEHRGPRARRKGGCRDRIPAARAEPG